MEQLEQVVRVVLSQNCVLFRVFLCHLHVTDWLYLTPLNDEIVPFLANSRPDLRASVRIHATLLLRTWPHKNGVGREVTGWLHDDR